MPKRKGSPKKLSQLQRQGEDFRFGGCGGPSNLEPGDSGDAGTKSKKTCFPRKKLKSSSTSPKKPIHVQHVSGLAELLEDSDYYVTIKQNPRQGALSNNDFYTLGNLKIKLHDHSIQEQKSLPVCDEFWLYVSRIPGRSMIYFEWLEECDEHVYKHVQVFTVEDKLDISLYNVPLKTLALAYESFDSITRELTLSVNLKKSAILSLENARSYGKNASVPVQKVMEQLHNIEIPECVLNVSGNSRDDIEALYTAVKSYHMSEESSLDSPNIDVQHTHLQVQLRPYQRASVHWMLRREALLHAPPSQDLHPLYKEVAIPSGDTLYYNTYLGVFVSERPTCMQSTPGGILADEMGLGKTVEVLSCMLANPRTDLPSAEVDMEQTEQMDEATMRQESKDKSKDNENIYGEGTSKDNSLYSNVEIKLEEDIQDDFANVSTVSEDKKDESNSSDCAEIPVDVTTSVLSEASLQEKTKREDHAVDENVSLTEKATLKEIKEENTVDKTIESVISENSMVDTATNEIQGTEENQSMSGRRRKCVRFAETAPSLIDYVDHGSESSDTSDTSWHEDEPKHKTKSKAPKKRDLKKPVKRLQPKAKSILKPDKNRDPIDETINAVIIKYCGARDLVSVAKKMEYINKRKAIQEMYERNLAEYSAVKSLASSRQRCSGFFKNTVERKSLFECICGAEDMDDGQVRVQCSQCSVWQHASCVRFNKKSRLQYFCPHCWQLQPVVPSRATLIVAPASISQQWMDEIKKLIVKKGINVEFYSGVNKEGFIQPRSLADHDIVITTYETLCKELDYVDLPHCNAEDGRKFRKAKRYMALPSPLPCIQWWRVCLDEAQMVECTTTRTAEMALRLASVHRWCITGTPVQKSISDLFGLMMFLGADPYCQLRWWVRLLEGPYRADNPNALHTAVCPLMWRTAKLDVLDQICIPEQKEQIHWIHFSPVEEHFYRRQHVQCANVVLSRIAQLSSLDMRLQMLRKDVLSGLISPLLRLRQACCHPQAVKGQFISLNKTTLTMEELLESLIKKARVESEESFRQIVASLNGIAAIHVIREEWLNAVERYREVLMMIEEHKEKVTADRLQRIHTLHNLAELLDSHPEGIPPTLRDANLRQEATDLETSYLNKCIALMKGAQQSVEPLSLSVFNLQEELVLPEAWWSLTMTWAEKLHEEHELVERVRQALMGGKRQFRISLYNSVLGLETLLLETTESLNQNRETLLQKMQQLETKEPQSLVNMAVECHLRTMPNPDAPTTKKQCLLCETSELFEKYEKFLFREEAEKGGHELVENVRVFGKLNRITWAEGETERILKALLGYAKLKKAESSWIQDGNTQIKLMDAMKKEFKRLRIYWRQLNDHVSALDELNMCKLRLRLRFPHEPNLVAKRTPKGNKQNKQQQQQLNNLSSNLQNKTENIYIIEPHEVETHALRLAVERSTAQGDMRRRMGQLQYLENLQRDGIGHKGGLNPEPCPICRKALGEKWCVLLCGHCYCLECLTQLNKHQMQHRIICCPVCRENTSMGEISHVNTRLQPEIDSSKVALETLPPPEVPDQDLEPQVLGRNSAKAEAVVLALKNILAEDPAAKALVFSTWASMLKVLERALRDNSISFAHIETGKKFQQAVNLFKDPIKHVTALLLPVQSGANGLNLIEATHVLLVEPILNPATELQALGRVHRIGQTKPTVVHRFVVRGTIEERMHVVLRAHQGSTKVDEDPVTLQDLYNMFASSPSGSCENGGGDSLHPTSSSTNAVENLAGPSNAM